MAAEVQPACGCIDQAAAYQPCQQSDQTGILASRTSSGLGGFFLNYNNNNALSYVWEGTSSWNQFQSGLVQQTGSRYGNGTGSVQVEHGMLEGCVREQPAYDALHAIQG